MRVSLAFDFNARELVVIGVDETGTTAQSASRAVVVRWLRRIVQRELFRLNP